MKTTNNTRETHKGVQTFYPKTSKQWRNWLEKYGQKKTEVFLILYNKNSGAKTLTMAQAVEDALCYGWIDSVANKRDADSRYQRFSPRRATSKWSAINKARVAKLIQEGLMTAHGQRTIDIAKEKGTWNTPLP